MRYVGSLKKFFEAKVNTKTLPDIKRSGFVASRLRRQNVDCICSCFKSSSLGSLHLEID